jgi:hypothetical protein
MISSESEDRLSLKQAARHPRFQRENGTYPDESTLFRWAFKGVRGIKLPVTRVGGRILTTNSSIIEFSDRLNAGTAQAPIPSRQQRIARARSRLADEGIGSVQ